MNDIVVELDGADGKKLPDSLRLHLVRNSHIRTNGAVAWESPVQEEGYLGDGLDVLTLVVTSAFALPGAISVVKSWVEACGTSVRVKSGRVTAVIKGAQSAAEYDAIVEALKAAAPANPTGQNGQEGGA